MKSLSFYIYRAAHKYSTLVQRISKVKSQTERTKRVHFWTYKKEHNERPNKERFPETESTIRKTFSIPIKPTDPGIRSKGSTFSTGRENLNISIDLKRFKTHGRFHHRTNHTVTRSYYRSDAGLTATGSAAAAAVLALGILDGVQRHHHDDKASKGLPRAKRTICSRKRRHDDVCLTKLDSWNKSPLPM